LLVVDGRDDVRIDLEPEVFAELAGVWASARRSGLPTTSTSIRDSA
jgi:hypothetical protein